MRRKKKNKKAFWEKRQMHFRHDHYLLTFLIWSKGNNGYGISPHIHIHFTLKLGTNKESICGYAEQRQQRQTAFLIFMPIFIFSISDSEQENWELIAFLCRSIFTFHFSEWWPFYQTQVYHLCISMSLTDKLQLTLWLSWICIHFSFKLIDSIACVRFVSGNVFTSAWTKR